MSANRRNTDGEERKIYGDRAEIMEIKRGRETAWGEKARKCILPETRDGGPQYLVVTYRGGMECGSGKEAELPVLGETGSHCHTVTVGTTHAVVVDR